MKKSTVSKSILALACLASLGLSAQAQTAPAEPESTLSFNVGAVSDYRFRGIEQTAGQPSVQGGVDYAHASGFYAGAWASTIQWIKDGGGDSDVEIDTYLGYKTDTVFAVEAAYFNFGRYKGVAGSDFLDYDTKGLVVALVMRGAVVPQLPQLRLVGRFGMSMLDTHANGRFGAQTLGRTDHSNKPYFGVGLEYEVMPQLKVTAAADFTKANYYGETASLRLLSLGAQYDF